MNYFGITAEDMVKDDLTGKCRKVLATMKPEDVEGMFVFVNPDDPIEKRRPVPASNFMGTIAANVDNKKLDDAEFRAFIRRTLPIVQYEGAE